MVLVGSPRRFVTDQLGRAGSVAGRGELRSPRGSLANFWPPACRKQGPAGSGWVLGRVWRDGVKHSVLRGQRRVWLRAVRKANLAPADAAFSYDIRFF